MTKTNGNTFHISTVGRQIDLNQLRTKLEAIVAPYLSRKKTSIEIQFRGKRSYIGPQCDQMPVLALQLLYGVEDARARGDVDRAIQQAMSLGEFHAALECNRMFAEYPIAAAAKLAARKGRSVRALEAAAQEKNTHYQKLRIEAAERMKVEVPKRGSIRAAAQVVRQTFAHLEHQPSIRFIELAHQKLNRRAPR